MTLAPSPANSTSLAQLKERTKNLPPDTPLSFFSAGGLDLMQRAAIMLSCSTLVPTAYRNVCTDKKGNEVKNESALSNCVLALNMAQRIGADPLMVMQNLYIVHGTPTWSAQFLIATFNKSGRFSAIRYEFESTPGKDDWGCRAQATELATGEKLQGPLITLGLAKREGWYGKQGSKWQTMPEQMLRYRAAAWLVRAYAPEIAMGLHTADEIQDAVIDVGQAVMEDFAPKDMAARPDQPEDPAPDDPMPEEPEEDLAEAARNARDIECPTRDDTVSRADCDKCPEKKRGTCENWN